MSEKAKIKNAMGRLFLFLDNSNEKNKNNPMATAKRNSEVQESKEGVACISISEKYNKATKRSIKL